MPETEESKPSDNYLCENCGSTKHNTDGHGRVGGARANSGRPKGSMNENTKLKRAAKSKFDERIVKVTDKLINAQLLLALGETNLYVVRKTKDGSKRVEIEEDTKVIQAYLDNTLDYDRNTRYYYIANKPPNNKAIDSLFNRTYGRPQDHIDVTSGGEPIPILGGASVPSDDSDKQAPETQEKD